MRKSILVVFVDVKIVSIPKLTDEWTWYKLTYVRQSTLFFVYGYIFIFIEYFEKSRVFFWSRNWKEFCQNTIQKMVRKVLRNTENTKFCLTRLIDSLVCKA